MKLSCIFFLGTDPATSKAKPVLAASSRLHTEPDFNQPLRSDTTPFPLLPKQTLPGSEKALRQRCRSASTPSKDERSDPPSSTARRSPLRRHPSASIHNILPLQTFIYEVNLRIFPARGGGGGSSPCTDSLSAEASLSFVYLALCKTVSAFVKANSLVRGAIWFGTPDYKCLHQSVRLRGNSPDPDSLI